MKKQGFTLAEALVTLGVIGVVAALILPAVNSMRPDQNKVLYLKAHDALGYALSGIASNSKLFPAYIQEQKIPCSSYPLINTEAPVEERFADYTGKTKLCNLLALSMNVDSNNIDCSQNSYNFSAATFDLSSGTAYWETASAIRQTEPYWEGWNPIPKTRKIGGYAEKNIIATITSGDVKVQHTSSLLGNVDLGDVDDGRTSLDDCRKESTFTNRGGSNGFLTSVWSFPANSYPTLINANY